MPEEALAYHLEPMPKKYEMDAPDGVPVPRRYWAILTIGLALLLAVIDGAIANVVLPTIARDVHASPSASIWMVNTYGSMQTCGGHYAVAAVASLSLAERKPG